MCSWSIVGNIEEFEKFDADCNQTEFSKSVSLQAVNPNTKISFIMEKSSHILSNKQYTRNQDGTYKYTFDNNKRETYNTAYFVIPKEFSAILNNSKEEIIDFVSIIPSVSDDFIDASIHLDGKYTFVDKYKLQEILNFFNEKFLMQASMSDNFKQHLVALVPTTPLSAAQNDFMQQLSTSNLKNKEKFIKLLDLAYDLDNANDDLQESSPFCYYLFMKCKESGALQNIFLIADKIKLPSYRAADIRAEAGVFAYSQSNKDVSEQQRIHLLELAIHHLWFASLTNKSNFTLLDKAMSSLMYCSKFYDSKVTLGLIDMFTDQVSKYNDDDSDNWEPMIGMTSSIISKLCSHIRELRSTVNAANNYTQYTLPAPLVFSKVTSESINTISKIERETNIAPRI